MNNNFITFSGNFAKPLPRTNKSVLFGIGECNPEHCFVDEQTGDKFFGLPPSLAQSNEFTKIWQTSLAKKPYYQCSTCQTNVFHEVLCCLTNPGDVSRDSHEFYCNSKCEGTLLDLELHFEGIPVRISQANSGVQLKHVYQAIGEYHQLNPAQFHMDGMEPDDNLGALVKTDKRTIAFLTPIEPKEPSDPFSRFGVHRGTETNDESHRRVLSKLENGLNARVCWQPVQDFLKHYQSLPAITGPAHVLDYFYVDTEQEERERVLCFANHDDIVYEEHGDKQFLYRALLQALFDARGKEYILKDEAWRTCYEAFYDAKEAEAIVGELSLPSSPRIMFPEMDDLPLVEEERTPVTRKRDRSPVGTKKPMSYKVLPVQFSEDEDDEPKPSFRELIVDSMTDAKLLKQATTGQATLWYEAFIKFCKEVLLDPNDHRVPSGNFKVNHVGVRDGKIVLSKKTKLLVSDRKLQTHFFYDIACEFTKKWGQKGCHKLDDDLMAFKASLGSMQLFCKWIDDNLKPRKKLRQQGRPEDRKSRKRKVLQERRRDLEEELSLFLQENELNESDTVAMEKIIGSQDFSLDELSLDQINRIYSLLIKKSHKPETHDELRQLASQTQANTDKALSALKGELKNLNNKVVTEPKQPGDKSPNYAEQYSLDPSVIEKNLPKQQEDDDDDSSGFSSFE